ncbi:MAG: glycosyltransferase [Pyrinomonadaceae bacterium]
MKIVRIIARLNVGGPARHVVWLNAALDDGEFESTLVTGTVPEGEEDMGYFAEGFGIEPVFIKEMSRELSPKDLTSLWKIYKELRRNKPDIVHTHTAKAGTVGRVAGFFYRWLTPGTIIGKPRKLKIVHTFHGHVFHSYYGKTKTRVFLFIEKMLARFASDKIVVISSQQKEEIHRDFAIGNNEQFAIIPLGIDLTPFGNKTEARREFRHEIGATEDELLVGLVGRVTEIKNIGMFLAAAHNFGEAVESDVSVRFVIIGDGNLRPDLKSRSIELGLAEKVIFTGSRNDPEVFYAGLDIVALTSLNEGTPLSLIEAMASKKPVISTMVGGVKDLLGEKKEESGEYAVCERGIAVASSDVLGFRSGLKRLIEDKTLRVDLAEKGYEFVHAEYSKDRLVTDIKQLYRDLVSP